MSLPFDATLKDLAAQGPPAFLAEFDVPPTGPVRVLNPDLSTVTSGADVVFGLGDPLTTVVHIDFQASASATKHCDLLVYNALLHRQFRVPVHTLILLLRPQARHRNLDGTLRFEARPGRGRMDFGYEVIELWERPAEQLLAGGLGTLPLAPLGRLPEGVSLEEGLTVVIRRLVERVFAEAPQDQARRLLTSAYVLTGMRVPRDQARHLFQGVRAMHESDTYLAILEEGAAARNQKMLLLMGGKRFGKPDEGIKTTIEAITDLDHLERLTLRILDATSWTDLLQTP